MTDAEHECRAILADWAYAHCRQMGDDEGAEYWDGKFWDDLSSDVED